MKDMENVEKLASKKFLQPLDGTPGGHEWCPFYRVADVDPILKSKDGRIAELERALRQTDVWLAEVLASIQAGGGDSLRLARGTESRLAANRNILTKEGKL